MQLIPPTRSPTKTANSSLSKYASKKNKIMKSFNIYHCLYILVLLPWLASCYVDKGNYEYTSVTEIKIDTAGMPNRHQLQNVELGTQLNLKPKIEYVKDASALEYFWIIYPYSYQPIQDGNAIVWPQADTIGYNQELDWLVDANPGTYNMQFVVTDPETGLRSFQWMYLNIPSKGTRSGLYILSEFDGKTDVELYGSARALIIGGDHLTKKYYSSLNGGEMIPGAPKFIATGQSYYYVFTQQQGLRLNQNGLQLMDNFQEMFYTAPNFNPQKIMFTNSCEFFLNDGKLHVMYTNKANDRKFSAQIAGNYNAFPFLAKMTRTTYGAVAGAINSDQVVFDKTTKAFRPYFPQGNSLSQFKQTEPGAFVDANNMKHEPVAILESNGGQIYNIMRINGRDSLHVIRIYNVVDDGDLSVGGNSKVSLEGCQGISQAKYFASSTAGSAFFYATDNSVHSFSYTSGQTNQEDIFQCPAGEVVTAMYQMPPGGFPTQGCVLWIATWNESKKEGTLYEFEVDPTSGKIRTYWTTMFAPHLANPHITTGFGKIVSMIIKA